METVRFAEIGLGNIAQVAVLPAFETVGERCALAALISSDAAKLRELGERYQVEHRGSYDELERVLREGDIDAAYIATPNTLHRELVQRCAAEGVHVLCEKPLATTSEDCEAMIEACDDHDVLLMVAYRLHFEPANLAAIEIARSGQLGELRAFTSTFGDIRTRGETGGGALLDLGVYCVNAARYLFQAEPEEVLAMQSAGHDPRFAGVDEITSALLRFPGDRFAQLTASQGMADVSEYRIIGTEGDLRVEPAYSYHASLVHHLTRDNKTEQREFGELDQFGPELVYFAKCIAEGEEPEPNGEEGLADVRVLEAIGESAREGKSVALGPFLKRRRPGPELAQREPPVLEHDTVNAPSPKQ